MELPKEFLVEAPEGFPVELLKNAVMGLLLEFAVVLMSKFEVEML